MTGHSSRTVNDDLNLIIDAPNFTVDYFDFVADAMRNPQDLRKGHTSFLVGQVIKPLDRIL